MSLKIKTRYAPSPTGFFHIGGARTALFNYLFAKHNKGTFIVRIEDTDTERNVEGGIESQLNNLKWLDIYPDESILNPGNNGPYKQSEKFPRYKELAYKLLQENKAYRCFCTENDLDLARKQALIAKTTPKYNRKCIKLMPEEIECQKNKPYTIRLKIEDNTTICWKDLIRGIMEIPTNSLTDPVILKSSGIPTYNFAVVVDDYDMDISHVFRGEEHISNTPYQIAIKNALGFDTKNIEYGHLSIIVDETGKKLSKRNLELKQFIEEYKTMGFVPQAINNFMVLLGWTSKTNKEIFDKEELINDFDIDRISKAPAFFDFKKMLWTGNQYFKKMNDHEYLVFVKRFLKINLSKYTQRINFDNILLIFKNQISYASEINSLIPTTFGEFSIDTMDKELLNIIQTKEAIEVMNLFKNILNNYEDISFEQGSDIMNIMKEKCNYKGKQLFMPLRIACIGKEHGPEMNKTISIIGKNNILKNINLLLHNK